MRILCRPYPQAMKSTTTTTLSLLLILLSSVAFAQMPTLPVANPNNKGGFKMPNIARMYGKVLDAKTKEPVEFAAVALLWYDKDSAIAGMLVKGNGDFSLDNLPLGGFRLKISFIGYKTLEQKIFISPQKMEQDLGNIVLEQDEALLNEVTVSGEKGAVTMAIDRRIYNVDKDISTRGGTALDVMKNVPSVTVDADGNASLRNSATQIYVDGRPTTLTLAQIPADQIDRVEIITNPSVKFDASTMGGILNIVMKKNTKPGYNGIVMGGIGTSNRYNGMANLNIKEKAFNFFMMYTYNNQENITKGYTHRSNIYNASPYGYFNQDNNTDSKNTFQFGRVGFDYSINNRNTITLSENIVRGQFGTIDKQEYTNSDGNKNLLLYGDRTNDQQSWFINYTTQALYKRTYPKQGKELTADLNQNHSISEFNNDFSTNSYLNGGIVAPFSPTKQKNIGGSGSDMYTFQLDYVNPLNENSKFETGIRSYYKNTSNLSTTSNYNYSDQAYQKDSILSNNYLINEMVNAAYVNYSSKLLGINYQSGLRFEQSYYKGDITDKKQSFSYSYPTSANNVLKSIFPALYFSKKFVHNQEVQLNFSRKINRPNFFQLMPFIMFADKQNYRIGNPQLTPEFTNIAEANYNIIYGKINFLSSVYYKYTESPITNVSYPSAADSLVLVNTFVNGKSSFTNGWDNTIKLTLFKNLDVVVNANVFYTNITSGTIGNNASNSGYSWFGKANLSYKFPKDFTLQLNGSYEAPKIIPQGTTLKMYFADVTLNKMINKKWILNLTLSDMFNTKRMGSHYDTPYYMQDLSRRREARFVRLNVTYMFGKLDSSIFKRKGQKRDGQNTGNQDGLDF